MQQLIKVCNPLYCRCIKGPLFIAIAIFLLSPCTFSIKHALAEQHSVQASRVIHVNDGDTVTVLMNGKEYRCRLIGIDAPEMGQEPWGERAKEHLRKILKDLHWKVSIEVGLEEYDKYNRLLVYLWSEDKRLVNEQMLLDGYAVLFTMQPNSKYVDQFRNAQRIARGNKAGIWGPDGLKERPVEYKKKHPRVTLNHAIENR